MKEYRIIKQYKDAKPYSLWTLDSFEACYGQLLVLIENTADYFHRDYYVFNDFYKNECSPSASNKFKIEVRDVGAWKTYEEKEKEDQYKNDNKIIKIY